MQERAPERYMMGLCNASGSTYSPRAEKELMDVLSAPRDNVCLIFNLAGVFSSGFANPADSSVCARARPAFVISPATPTSCTISATTTIDRTSIWNWRVQQCKLLSCCDSYCNKCKMVQ